MSYYGWSHCDLDLILFCNIYVLLITIDQIKSKNLIQLLWKTRFTFLYVTYVSIKQLKITMLAKIDLIKIKIFGYVLSTNGPFLCEVAQTHLTPYLFFASWKCLSFPSYIILRTFLVLRTLLSYVFLLTSWSFLSFLFTFDWTYNNNNICKR